MSYPLPYIGDPLPQPAWQGPWWGIFPPVNTFTVWPTVSTHQTPEQLKPNGDVIVDGHRYRFEDGNWILVTKE